MSDQLTFAWFQLQIHGSEGGNFKKRYWRFDLLCFQSQRQVFRSDQGQRRWQAIHARGQTARFKRSQVKIDLYLLQLNYFLNYYLISFTSLSKLEAPDPT